jgi:5-methylcytosine-specific restriction protein A
MNAESCEQICALIARKLGLPVTASITNGVMTLSPSGFHPRESFSILFEPGWRSAEARLVPGEFAGEMLRSMGTANEDAKKLFNSYAAGLVAAGINLQIQINGESVEGSPHLSWPHTWTSFAIALRKTALVFDLNKNDELLPVSDLLVTPLFGMAIALIGTESGDVFEGEEEGKAMQYLATRYERKKINRDACIRIRGLTCLGCGFRFGEFYGNIADGYIEIHHIESLAATGEVHINPAVDLIPLCSNCHSVVHRVTPPLLIEELQRMIAERRSK